MQRIDMATFEVADGVHGIDGELFDTGFLSVYLFDDEGPTLVDAGMAASAEAVLEGVEACGVDPSDLENLVLSHIHLDHSGATSALVEAVPDLDVYIHGMTARHLTNPDALVESTRSAMGEHFEVMGEPAPVPAESVVEVGDEGITLDIGTNRIEMIHAPGHSPDHFAVWSPEQRVLYSAECIGSYLEGADRWIPPSTLPNFDVETLETTIRNLRSLDPEHVLFAHGRVWPHDPEEAFETAEAELHRFDDRILELYEETGSVEATTRAVAEELLNISPPYGQDLEAFHARLVTRGYLKYHDLL
jgi:glyoxylase-like metal-dependent hydrolase (beta-lactamase superfamily II)